MYEKIDGSCTTCHRLLTHNKCNGKYNNEINKIIVDWTKKIKNPIEFEKELDKICNDNDILKESLEDNISYLENKILSNKCEKATIYDFHKMCENTNCSKCTVYKCFDVHDYNDDEDETCINALFDYIDVCNNFIVQRNKEIEEESNKNI